MKKIIKDIIPSTFNFSFFSKFILTPYINIIKYRKCIEYKNDVAFPYITCNKVLNNKEIAKAIFMYNFLLKFLIKNTTNNE